MQILSTEVFAVNEEGDIVTIRKIVRERAIALKCNLVTQTKLVTAASELTRNIIKYASRGVLTLNTISDDGRQGIQMIFKDEGPGISDISLAMTEGFSTGKSLGLGLSGSKRLVDEFEISSQVGHGTQVKLILWK
jgi:serine/threonine-protein kinase RsbT